MFTRSSQVIRLSSRHSGVCRKFSTSSPGDRFSSSNGVGAPVLLAFGLGAAAGMLVLQPGNTKAAGSRKDRKSVISTTEAPAAVGPYSQAIEDTKTGTIYCSGQVGLIPGTKQLISNDVREQTTQALSNLKNVLKESGAGMENVVKTTVLLADINDYVAVNEVYAQHFTGGAPPARAAFAVKALPVGAKVEIDAIAIK